VRLGAVDPARRSPSPLAILSAVVGAAAIALVSSMGESVTLATPAAPAPAPAGLPSRQAVHPTPTADALTLDANARATVIESLVRELQDRYVFPQGAAKIAQDLTARQAQQEYAAISDPAEFSAVLTSHLRAVSGDKHLGVQYGAAPPPVVGGTAGVPGPTSPDILPLINYGFHRVERLPGNVGYLDLRIFIDTKEGSGDTATAAMSFLAHTDALIVDLRQNGGGFPTMIQFLCSYLFDPEPVLLNTFYFRAGDRREVYP
jgi:hypothetical protein